MIDTKPAASSGSSNASLQAAKRAKNDEFYTRLVDIEKELSNYKQHFKNKIVYCNCDDPDKSQFIKYFVMNFAHLGLKRLVATSYNPEIMGKGKILMYDGTRNPTGIPNADEVNVFELNGNGDWIIVDFDPDSDFVPCPYNPFGWCVDPPFHEDCNCTSCTSRRARAKKEEEDRTVEYRAKIERERAIDNMLKSTERINRNIDEITNLIDKIMCNLGMTTDEVQGRERTNDEGN